ncbi:VOC family protein [Maricaulis virginensis]|uniref:Lactoylglutathione lyase n=1 Tax=Maricaulis virginensis TaxID=144022 RepID=A0A9W6IQ96_9PROT|nr:VOC family protein [Maricaulis virginensis]GLK53677.1 lactoylglutathione lyase [Maricaulis virginensis]
MRYLHTMVRVSDLDASLRFYCEGLGLKEISRMDSEKGRFTLIFLATPEDVEAAGYPGGVYTGSKIPEGLPCVELTHNWDPEEYTGGRNFGHLAYRMDNVYDTCARLQAMGYTINRPPRDGHMAFVRSPDGISVELLQRGDNLPPQEPWASMENTGSW